MAARRMMLPDYGTVSMKGTQYYRTRVTDQQGRRVSLYARTREELYQKEQEAIQQIENKTYRRSTPTVEEYCEKWLLMQSAQIRMTTLIDYTSKVKNYIIKPLGDMHMGDVTAYVNGQSIKHRIKPRLGEHQPNNPKLVYTMDFKVTPHMLRHTYITNLIYKGVDPKTVQYLAGHENSKTTMDIYAKVKYNKPEELSSVVNAAFGLR